MVVTGGYRFRPPKNRRYWLVKTDKINKPCLLRIERKTLLRSIL